MADSPPRLPLHVRSGPDSTVFTILYPHETGYDAAYALAVAAHQCFGSPLPYADVDAKTAAEKANKKGTVLVVDDNQDILDLIQRALEGEGYEVLATIGDGAVRAARDRQPNLILMDMVMPGMDGLEASQLLANDPATAHIPVVSMTGLSLLKRATGLPVADHLPKPFSIEDLVTMVTKWVAAPGKHGKEEA